MDEIIVAFLLGMAVGSLTMLWADRYYDYLHARKKMKKEGG